MSEQERYFKEVNEEQYLNEISDLAVLIKHFGARQVFKDLQVHFPELWMDIYSAVVYKDNPKVPALFKSKNG